jgi:hypothetical protein
LDKAISHLIEIGKLSLVDGALTNQRTEQELEKIRERLSKNRENSALGGEANRRRFAEKASPSPEEDALAGQAAISLVKCAVCRKSFHPTRSDAKTCSATCRQIFIGRVWRHRCHG